MKRWMLIALFVCACGSSNNNNNGGSSGPGSITGTVGGQPLNVKDAVYVLENNSVNLVVTDRENTCALLSGTTLPGPTTALFVSVANFVPPNTLSPLVTGDYAFFDLAGPLPTSAGRYWYGGFETLDTSCKPTGTTPATGGTVTVTQTGSVTPTATHFKANLTGLHFGTDTLNGNIEATYCAALLNPVCGAVIAQPPGAVE